MFSTNQDIVHKSNRGLKLPAAKSYQPEVVNHFPVSDARNQILPSKTMSCTSHSHNFWPPRGVSCSIPWIRPSTNQSIRSRQAIIRISITCIYYSPVLARFIPMLLKGDMLGLILGLILGLSSLSVPFILANSFSCSFLY